MNHGVLLAFFIATTIFPPATKQIATYSKTQLSERFLVNSDRSVILNVPFVHQIDSLPEEKKSEIKSSACGPAAITMILNYFGENIDLYSVIDNLPTSVYIKGSMFYNLYDGPRYFNKTIRKISNNPQEIYNTLKEGSPIILNIQNYNGITGHAVVIVGVKEFDGTNAKSLIVHDPYKEAFREFKYVNRKTLLQPEGFQNYIGILEPFIILDNPHASL